MVWVAYYYDGDVEAFELIGAARTSEGAKTLAERWAQQNGVKPTYETWTFNDNGEWTLRELFVRQLYMFDETTP